MLPTTLFVTLGSDSFGHVTLPGPVVRRSLPDLPFPVCAGPGRCDQNTPCAASATLQLPPLVAGEPAVSFVISQTKVEGPKSHVNTENNKSNIVCFLLVCSVPNQRPGTEFILHVAVFVDTVIWG